MLFAQLPQATAEQFGVWVVIALGILGSFGVAVGIAVGIKKLFQPSPIENQAITRAEFNEIKLAVNLCVTKVEFSEMKSAIAAFATKAEVAEVRTVLDKLDEYSHSQMHELANKLQPISSAVAIVQKQQESQEKQLFRLLDETTANGKRMERLAAFLERDYHAHAPGTRVEDLTNDG
jgi:G3E family GTPase